MTSEERQLLLKDLCARLPYGNTEIKVTEPTNDIMGEVFVGRHICSTIDIEDFILGKYIIRPYLRQMNSMTEEERNEWISLMKKEYREQYPYSAVDTSYYEYFPTIKSFDYLNSHHFDYRGLLEKGLALIAPEEMYKNG